MQKLIRQGITLSLLLMSIVSGGAQAEQAKDFGDYTVHYMAVNTTFLKPDIAREYGITRGDRLAFLNIAVMKKQPDGSSKAVSARVSGVKKNLLQQSEGINFMEITEGDSIYYIGEFEFSNAEDLNFEIQIQPESSGQSYPLTWSTRLYTD